jgi:hypothetical protein
MSTGRYVFFVSALVIIGCFDTGLKGGPGDEEDSTPGQETGAQEAGNDQKWGVPVETVAVDSLGVSYGTDSLGMVRLGLSSLELTTTCEDLFERLKRRAAKNNEAIVNSNLQAVLNLIDSGMGCPQYESQRSGRPIPRPRAPTIILLLTPRSLALMKPILSRTTAPISTSWLMVTFK